MCSGSKAVQWTPIFFKKMGQPTQAGLPTLVSYQRVKKGSQFSSVIIVKKITGPDPTWPNQGVSKVQSSAEVAFPIQDLAWGSSGQCTYSL